MLINKCLKECRKKPQMHLKKYFVNKKMENMYVVNKKK